MVWATGMLGTLSKSHAIVDTYFEEAAVRYTAGFTT